MDYHLIYTNYSGNSNYHYSACPIWLHILEGSKAKTACHFAQLPAAWQEHTVVIGPHCREPFRVKGLIGMSAMSYGALGENAISALSKGISMAGGSWMNTGEGGLSDYHLAGNTDIIAQIGPGLFGVRT